MTETNQELVTFESKKIRKEWHNERWYFSVVDVVSVLIEKDHQSARKYWNKLSERLKKEGAKQVPTSLAGGSAYAPIRLLY